MVKRIAITAVAGLLLASIALTAQKNATKSGTWSGWVTDTSCEAKGANAQHAACATKCVKEQGAKYALYNAADKKVYVLDPQDKAAPHAGHEVTVNGTLDGDTIHFSSITMAAPKGGM
jgi:Protein of unknown function (DUF5818)